MSLLRTGLLFGALLTASFNDCHGARGVIEEQYPGVEIPDDVVVCSAPADPDKCQPQGTGGASWELAKNVIQVSTPNPFPSLAAEDPQTNTQSIESALRTVLLKEVLGNTYGNGSIGFCSDKSIAADPALFMHVDALKYDSKVDSDFSAAFAAQLDATLKSNSNGLDANASAQLKALIEDTVHKTIGTSIYYFIIQYRGKWEDFVTSAGMLKCLKKAVREHAAIVSGANGFLFVDTKTKYQSLGKTGLALKLQGAIQANDALKTKVKLDNLEAAVEASYNSATAKTVTISSYLSPLAELAWVQFTPVIDQAHEPEVMEAASRPDCGLAGLACCVSNQCQSGLICDKDKICSQPAPCGAQGQGCCADSKCTSGLVCELNGNATSCESPPPPKVECGTFNPEFSGRCTNTCADGTRDSKSVAHALQAGTAVQDDFEVTCPGLSASAKLSASCDSVLQSDQEDAKVINITASAHADCGTGCTGSDAESGASLVVPVSLPKAGQNGKYEVTIGVDTTRTQGWCSVSAGGHELGVINQSHRDLSLGNLGPQSLLVSLKCVVHDPDRWGLTEAGCYGASAGESRNDSQTMRVRVSAKRIASMP